MYGRFRDEPTTGGPEDMTAEERYHARENVNNENSGDWSPYEVGLWLEKIGLSELSSTFTRHKISGKILPQLQEKHLKEMGVDLVGDRILLMGEAQRLHIKSQNQVRFQEIWSGYSPQFTDGPCDWCVQWCCCAPLWQQPNHYKLTANSLIITEVSEGTCCNMWGTKQLVRNIDLSNVAGFNMSSSQKACECNCAADYIHVDLHESVGLEPVPPTQPRCAPASPRPRGRACLHGRVPRSVRCARSRCRRGRGRAW